MGQGLGTNVWVKWQENAQKALAFLAVPAIPGNFGFFPLD